MAMGVQINIDDPDQLEEIRKEYGIIIERIQKILASGANVILTTKGIDDLCLKNLLKMIVWQLDVVKRGFKKNCSCHWLPLWCHPCLIWKVRRLSKLPIWDIPKKLFKPESVMMNVFLIKGTKQHTSSSIILRGPNDFSLDEMQRSLHDSLSVVKRTLESGHVVPGGGAVEAALNIYLENFATTVGSREQLAIAEFCKCFMVIQRPWL